MGKAQQAFTAVAASFAAMLMGSLNVWPSYTLEHYISPNSTVLETPMTEIQASLVGSLPSLGAMLGSVLTGVIIDTYGRRLGAILLVLPYVVSVTHYFCNQQGLRNTLDRNKCLVGSLPSLGAMLGSVLTGVIIDTYGRRLGAILLVLPYVVSVTHYFCNQQGLRNTLDRNKCLVGSLPSLGAMLGSVLTGVIIDTYGRRLGAILLVLPYVVSVTHYFCNQQGLRNTLDRNKCLVGSLPSLGAMLGSVLTGVIIYTYGRRLGAILLVLPYVVSVTHYFCNQQGLRNTLDRNKCLVGILPSLGAMLGSVLTGVIIDTYGRRLGATLLVLPYVVSVTHYYCNQQGLRNTRDRNKCLVGSLPSLGAMLGSVLTGVIIDTYGRRLGAILLMLPYVFHWVVIALSSSAIPIIVARFFGGIPGGGYVVYAPIFISEIAEPSIRGTLASTTVVFYFLGAAVSYTNGWFLAYTSIVWVNLALCAVNLIFLFLVVESPVFLLRQNKEQAALKALSHYRDGSTTSKSVLEELSAMKQQLLPPVEMAHVRTGPELENGEKEKLNAGQDESVATPNMPSWKLLFKHRSSRRAFFTVWTVLTLQVLMGAVAVQVYAGKIFSEAAPDLSASFCSVLVALISFSGCALAMAITDKAGRRVLVISSSALVALCMGVIGLQIQLRTPPLLTAATILVFCFVFNYGAGSVPYVLLAEVFSPEVQSIASMILMESMWFTNFLLIGIFPSVLSLVGMHGACYAFSCVAAANAYYAYLRVPETKGLTNKDIQAIFAK